jgi:phosphopantetheinyl transferase
MAAVNAPPIQCRAPGAATVLGTAGVVDVWQADLARVEDGFGELLCAQELARAARILPERKRMLWARSRGVLRVLLGHYLDRDPRGLRFALGPHGKPALRQEAWAKGTDLRFSLSHSGGLALIAVTAGREVGVDIECARERYTAEFLRAWVAHEAVVKCRGVGLATPPAGPHPDDPWTAELDVGPPTAAAVAVADGPCELRRYRW